MRSRGCALSCEDRPASSSRPARPARPEDAHPAPGVDWGALLEPGGPNEPVLRRRADAVRAGVKGPTVRLRALLEFSNRCVQNCLYCGLRRGNRRLERYALEPDEIVTLALRAVRAGYATVVLQSGEDPVFDRDTVARIVAAIKEEAPRAAVTLSVGERSRADYKTWRRAGADRYLLKHETSDPALYARLRPGRRLAQRLRRAEWLKELGYELGLGNMIGLPGQSRQSLVDDLHLMARFQPAMTGIGPFIPHPATPLGGEPPGDAALTLNFVALTRLLLPQAHIPATTALTTLDPQARVEALRAGADVLMVGVGPDESRRLYEIYPGRTRSAGDGGTGGRDGREACRPRAPRDPGGEGQLELDRRRTVEWLRGLGREVDGVAGPGP